MIDVAFLNRTVPNLLQKSHSEKIRTLGWFLHTHAQKQSFSQSDVRACYDDLHEVPPSSFSSYFQSLVTQKLFIKNQSGYRLTGEARRSLDRLYNSASHKAQITALLGGLPAKIPNLAERLYLNEALICYENAAFRAAVVMTWNLAYHHLCDFVVRSRLTDFNARWSIKFPSQHKNGQRHIVKIDDFMEELKEHEMIAICKDANIITKDVWKILDEKLGRRNSAAHASSVSIGQLQADAFIDDLVTNVVLKIV